jgi:fatty-acyl-CoA synthase
MVDPDVLDRLVEVGGRFGLRPEAVKAAYGLSEGGGTITPADGGVRIDRIDLSELVSTGRAVAARPGTAVKRVASCGVPVSGVEIAIMGPPGLLDDRQVGEIVSRGSLRMSRYVGDAANPVVDGWLHTGDLGYLAEGELFVTGRSKELIISFGHNYHPEDIERSASRVPGVQPGGCVAFSLPNAKEGSFAVVVEATDGAEAGLEDRVSRAVSADTGLVPRVVAIVEPGTIPRTPSGKLQRLPAREAFGRGELADAASGPPPLAEGARDGGPAKGAR